MKMTSGTETIILPCAEWTEAATGKVWLWPTVEFMRKRGFVEVVETPHVPAQEEIVAGLVNAVQFHLDATAQTRNYDGILSLCTYVTSTDPVFAAEGQAGVEWRDACWRTCYEVMAECQAGTRPIPTAEEILALLPVIQW